MTDINSVVLVGRLVRDSELRYTSGGTPVAGFSVASSLYQGKDKDNYTSYFDCQMWGKMAESINQYLTKGSQVVINGELKQERWKKDGNARSRVIINVRNIELVGGKQGNSGSDRPNNGNLPPSAPSGGNSQGYSDNSFQDDVPF